MKYTTIQPQNNSERDQLISRLNEEDAVVIEGIHPDFIKNFVSWTFNLGGATNDDPEVIQFSGKQLNGAWSLTGDNQYPDDLNICAIPFSQIKQVMQLAIPRFSMGVRWWSDVRDNNLRREEEKLNN